MINFKISQDINEFWPEWNELLTQSDTGTVFQRPDYLSCWVASFINKEEVFIIKVLDDDELIGIAPFRKTEKSLNGLKSLKVTFLGTDHVGKGADLVTDFGDIVAKKGREKEAWQEIIRVFRELRGFREIILDYVRENSPSFRVLKDLGFSFSQMLDGETLDVAPALDLPDSFDDQINSLERKSRHEWRRKLRRLGNTGYYLKISENASDVDEFIRLHRASTIKKDLFMSVGMENFFTKTVTALFQKGLIDLVFMEIEGKNVSATLSFLWNKEYWLYNSGFDRKYENLAVGFLLKGLTIKRAIEMKYNKYNFLRGNERYKYELGARDEKLFKIIISNNK